MQNCQNFGQGASSKPISSALGIAKPTEMSTQSVSCLEMARKRNTSRGNTSDVYDNIAQEFNSILGWKASVEVTLQQKESENREFQHMLDSQRQNLIKAELEKERLQVQNTEELRHRKEILEKFVLTQDLVLTVKKSFEDFKKQFHSGLETKKLIDERYEETSQKFQELIHEYGNLKTAHLQKIAEFRDNVEARKERTAEIVQSYERKLSEFAKKIDSLNDAVAAKEREVDSCHKIMFESKALFENLQGEKESLQDEVMNLKSVANKHLDYIKEIEANISKIQKENTDTKNMYLTTYKTYTDLQALNADNVDQLEKCKEQLRTEEENFQKMLMEIRKDLDLEQQRVSDANATCELYKNEIKVLKDLKGKLETEINDCRLEIEKTNAIMKQREQQLVQKLEERNDELKQLQSVLDGTKEQMTSESQKVASLHEINETLKTQIGTLEGQIEDIRAKMVQKEAETKVRLEEKASMEEKLQEMEETHNFIQAEKDDLEKSIQNKQELLVKMQGEIDDLTLKISCLKGAKSSLDDDCASFTGKVKSLEAEVQERNEKLLKHEEEISKLMQDVEKKADLVTDLENRLQACEKELHKTKKTLDEERKEHEDEEQKSSNKLKECLVAKDGAMKKMQNCVHKLKKELHEERIKTPTPNLEAKILGDKISRLEKDVDEKNKVISKLQEELEKPKESGDPKLKDDIQKVKEERNIFCSKFAELQRDHTREMKIKGAEIMDLKKKMEIMKRQQSMNELQNSIKRISNVTASSPDVNKLLTPINNAASVGKIDPPVTLSIGASKLALKRLTKTPGVFVTLPKPKVRSQNDSFETSGSEYMEIEGDSEKNLKFVPVKKPTEKRKGGDAKNFFSPDEKQQPLSVNRKRSKISATQKAAQDKPEVSVKSPLSAEANQKDKRQLESKSYVSGIKKRFFSPNTPKPKVTPTTFDSASDPFFFDRL